MTGGGSKPPPPFTLQRALAGFYPAAAFLAGLELDLFAALARGPLDAGQLARTIDAKDETRLAALCDALCVYGFLVRDGERRYALTAESAAYLVPEAPGYIGPIAPVYGRFFRGGLDFARAVREATPSGAQDSSEDAFLRGIHKTALAAGRDIAKRFDLSGATHLIDAGCGGAGVAIAMCKALPGLTATASDLVPALPVAREFVAAAGLADRIVIDEGDVLKGPPPGGPANVVVARALLQVLGPAEAETALVNLARAVAPGGLLIVAGAVLHDDGLAPDDMVGFNLSLMTLFEHGRAYTQSEHEAWFAKAGMGAPARIVLPSGGSLLWARKP
ncbi:MAG: methyltransferase domain-containing protein [Alphaproteobacteria bacterium]|nr:methyltransferase domain-containing protein [Alphaproteobacteria bacterium]